MDNVLTIQTEALPSVSELHRQLLASLPLLDEAHKASKKDAFAHGVPFYTCIDKDGHWIKELQNGDKFLVEVSYDWVKDEPVERIIEKLS
jgi:hypothetical protein